MDEFETAVKEVVSLYGSGQMPILDSLFLHSDQPTQCPYCASRTEWYDIEIRKESFAVNFCRNPECLFAFIAVDK